MKSDEIYQLYVSTAARSSGAATLLLNDAEARLCARGVQNAWLVCTVGNERAARFCTKSGWRRVGNMMNELKTPEEIFALEVWRYEKDLRRR